MTLLPDFILELLKPLESFFSKYIQNLSSNPGKKFFRVSAGCAGPKFRDALRSSSTSAQKGELGSD